MPATGERADANGFEKRGIDNVLLPDGRRIPFARRRDLAQLEGTFRPSSQSARAQLIWEIDDNAIAQVNEHFRQLSDGACGEGREEACLSAGSPDPTPGLLVVDELGRLELHRGEGLTEAVALLRQGPTPAFPHALVVVREGLVDEAERQLGASWPDRCRIAPDDKGRAAVLAAVGA